VTNTWFVMIPPGYASASDAEKELVDFRVQYPAGSQAWADANAGRILSASESGYGQQLVRWKGPFATEAEARTAQNSQQQSPNPLNDLTNAAQNATGPLTGLAAIGDFFTKLGNANTWLRVAEVLLGAGIIIVALAKLAGDTPAGRAAVKAGKAAAIL
jgi:hypothetical protein